MPEFLVSPTALHEIRLFDVLEPAEARMAAAALVPSQYGAGETIFCEGEASDTGYILVKGRVEIVRDLPGGSRYVLATLTPGSVFGEMCLLTDLRRSASAIARERSEMWVLYRHVFDEALEADQVWAYKVAVQLAKVLVSRLEAVDREIVEMIARLPEQARDPSAGGLKGAPPAAAGPRSDFERLRERLIDLASR